MNRWTWFTQNTPVTATCVAWSDDTDPARIAQIDVQVVSAYAPNNDVIRIYRLDNATMEETSLYGFTDKGWDYGSLGDALLSETASQPQAYAKENPTTITSVGTRSGAYASTPVSTAQQQTSSGSSAFIVVAAAALLVGGLLFWGGGR